MRFTSKLSCVKLIIIVLATLCVHIKKKKVDIANDHNCDIIVFFVAGYTSA